MSDTPPTPIQSDTTTTTEKSLEDQLFEKLHMIADKEEELNQHYSAIVNSASADSVTIDNNETDQLCDETRAFIETTKTAIFTIIEKAELEPSSFNTDQNPLFISLKYGISEYSDSFFKINCVEELIKDFEQIGIDISIKLINSNVINRNNINSKNEEGNTALIVACTNKMSDVALQLVTMRPDELDVNAVDNHNNSALMIACYYDLVDVCEELLLNPKIDVNIVEDKYLLNALLIASSSEFTSEIALKLIDKTDDLAHTDDDDNNALMLSCINRLSDVALKLIEKMDARDFTQPNKNDGNNALMYACFSKLKDVALKLIEKTSDFSVVNDAGNNALMIACDSGPTFSDVALKLIKKMYYFGTVNNEGNNALMIACNNHSLVAALKLIKKMDKEELDATNRDGNTAFELIGMGDVLWLALKLQNTDIITLIFTKNPKLSYFIKTYDINIGGIPVTINNTPLLYILNNYDIFDLDQEDSSDEDSSGEESSDEDSSGEESSDEESSDEDSSDEESNISNMDSDSDGQEERAIDSDNEYYDSDEEGSDNDSDPYNIDRERDNSDSDQEEEDDSDQEEEEDDDQEEEKENDNNEVINHHGGNAESEEFSQKCIDMILDNISSKKCDLINDTNCLIDDQALLVHDYKYLIKYFNAINENGKCVLNCEFAYQDNGDIALKIINVVTQLNRLRVNEDDECSCLSNIPRYNLRTGVDNYEDDNFKTPLQTCLDTMGHDSEKVAIALIETDMSNPSNILPNSGKSAIITACTLSNENIALALLHTNTVNPFELDTDNKSAYSIALENGLNNVTDKFAEFKAQKRININEYGFDFATSEQLKISEFIDRPTAIYQKKEDGTIDIDANGNQIVEKYVTEYNICLRINKQNILLNAYELNKQFLEMKVDGEEITEQDLNVDKTPLRNVDIPDSLKYRCLIADHPNAGYIDENHDRTYIYFLLSAISTSQYLVKLRDLQKIIENIGTVSHTEDEKYKYKLYDIFETGIKIPIVSVKLSVSSSASSMSSDHCQVGGERAVCTILNVDPDETPIAEETTPEQKQEQEDIHEEPNRATILYKGNLIKHVYNEQTTINDLRNGLLEKAAQSGEQIDPTDPNRYNVRFIQGSTVKKADNQHGEFNGNQVVNTTFNLSNPIQASVVDLKPPVGGGRTRKQYNLKKKYKTKHLRFLYNNHIFTKKIYKLVKKFKTKKQRDFI